MEFEFVVYIVGADPGHQAIPSGWPTTLDGLNTQVFTSVPNLAMSNLRALV